MNKTARVDWLNVILVPLCLLLAYLVPFKLFLLAYAILGPIHYLTEINWLQHHNFFSKSKSIMWWIISIICLVMSFPIIIQLPLLSGVVTNFAAYNQTLATLGLLNVLLIQFCLVFCATLTFTKNPQHLIIASILSALAFFIFYGIPEYIIVIGVLTPTLLHVFVFTLLFMLYGALKSKSNVGMLSTLLHLSIPILIFNLPMNSGWYDFDQQTKNVFANSEFNHLTTIVAYFLGQSEREVSDVFNDSGTLKTQVFIAYAYLYHYLNWFSKTSIIGWGKTLTTKKSIIIAIVCMLSIGCYFYDFSTGLKLLFFLSMLHVLLEFPLNFVSFKGIFTLNLQRS